MPHSQHQLVAAIALGIAVLAGSGAVHAQAKASPEKKIYCWNEAGRKVCGDALPAEARFMAKPYDPNAVILSIREMTAH